MIRPVLTSYSYSFSADLKASKVAADGTLVESNRVQVRLPMENGTTCVQPVTVTVSELQFWGSSRPAVVLTMANLFMTPHPFKI